MAYSMPRGSNRFRGAGEDREKFCSFCNEWWSVDAFPAHPEGAGGLDNRCRACVSERRARGLAKCSAGFAPRWRK
jgi:hypothetical protein